MSKNIVHEGGSGDRMPWTNTTGAVVPAGAVVKCANTMGIALVTVAIGAVGTVAVGGVVRDVPKVTGDDWAQGEKLVWDVSEGKFAGSTAAVAAGDVTGGAFAWLAAASADATGVIKLTPGNTAIA